MPEKPVSFSRFGGLRLDLPLDEVGAEEAIDLLDVDWSPTTGRLQSREGTIKLETEAASAYNSLFGHSITQLLARRGALICAITASTGAEVKTAAIAETGYLSAARMGTPSAAYSYIASEGAATLKRWDGANFSEPTATVDGVAGKAMPRGIHLATWPDGGNRLVIAGTSGTGGPNGATSSESHVWFSNAGNAESYESTAYVQLSPGDGESIVGCCAWGPYIFVFKQSKMFVFSGVGVDSEGKPEFPYRTVTLGSEIKAPRSTAGPKAVAAPDAVYFIGADGVWMTTGQAPIRISTALDPLASEQELATPIKNTLTSFRWLSADGIFYRRHRLYIGFGGEARPWMFIFDYKGQRWTIWHEPFHSMAVLPAEVSERLYFTSQATGKRIWRFAETETEDAASTISARWQSGFYDLGSEDEKTLNLCKITGKGKIEVSVAKDFGAVGNATTFECGASTKAVQKNITQTGALFSHKLTLAAGASVQRFARYVQSSRYPGSES